MKTILTFSASLFFVAFVAGDSKSDISRVMEQYWTAYSSSEFNTIADQIHPSDLESARATILPVFLEISSSSDPELKFIADTFFSDVSEASRSKMTGKEVVVGLNLFIKTAAPQIFEAIKGSTIEISDISVSEESNATATYSIKMLGESATDVERFAKHDGRWFIRLKEDPKITANKFRQLFGI